MSPGIQLTAADLRALHRLGTVKEYRAAEFLFRQGDASDHVVAIRSGTAKIVATADSGYETVLAIRSVGEVVGEFAAFDLRRRSASVVAITPMQCLVVPGVAFRGYLRAQPDLALAMLSTLVDRLRESDRRRVEFGAYDVTSRISRLLLELAARHGAATKERHGGEGTTITLALSQQDLAGAVGASREAVARILQHLREQGAIATGRRRIVVLRPDVLRHLCAPETLPGSDRRV